MGLLEIRLQQWLDLLQKGEDAGLPIFISSGHKAVAKSLVRPDNVTAYSANDVISTTVASNLEFDNVNSVDGGGIIIHKASLKIITNSLPAGIDGFNIHLFTEAPTPIADADPFQVLAVDASKYIGYIPLSTPVLQGEICFIQKLNIGFNFNLAPGSTSIFAQVETLGGLTPTAELEFIFELDCLGV